MNIECGNYILKSDNMNLWVEEMYTTKKGEDASRVVTGYHQDFEHLAESFMMRRIRGSDAESMKQLLADMKSAESDMRHIIKKLAKEVVL